EAAVRKWKRIAGAALVVGTAATVLALRASRAPTEIRIVGEDGTKMVLRSNALTLSDEAGDATVNMSAHRGVGDLTVSSKAGTRVTLSADSSASVRLAAGNSHFGSVSPNPCLV